jgi:hypothetical protein
MLQNNNENISDNYAYDFTNICTHLNTSSRSQSKTHNH